MRSSFPPGLIRLLIVAFLAGTTSAQTPPVTPTPSGSESPTVITASFWNVQWFPGRRPNPSRAEENRQIHSVQRDVAQLTPDIVALEEVRDSENASLAIRFLEGFKIDVCSHFLHREGQNESQQIAIASRLQPIAAWAESWKRGTAILPPRGFAFAAYQASPNRILLVYALHLKSNRGEIHEDMGIREESMRQLLQHIKAMETRFKNRGAVSWIIGGDFNTAPEEPRFAREKTIPALQANGFSWAWQGIPFSTRITLPSDLRYPPAAFDQIFYRNATLTKAWVAYTSPQSSDHRPVNATLNLK